MGVTSSAKQLITWLEVEDRLPDLLGDGNQAREVLEKCDAIRIIINCLWPALLGRLQHFVMKDCGNLAGPSLIPFDRTVGTRKMLLYDVASWHEVMRKWRGYCSFSSTLPILAPVKKHWTHVAQSLEAEQVRSHR